MGNEGVLAPSLLTSQTGVLIADIVTVTTPTEVGAPIILPTVTLTPTSEPTLTPTITSTTTLTATI
ncbi:MAG: hypothetical protein K8R40_09540, partial [Anaerolineaceae bacterium]|nr:hypothetical protein [Anaerolineaceae bacterium]